MSRSFMNDFYLNSFYVLWTSFWYIPTFMLILLLIFSLNTTLLNRFSTGIFIYFLLICLLTHYQNLNAHNFLQDNLGEHFNILLSNSINKFHPALFYTSLLIVVGVYTSSIIIPTNSFTMNTLIKSFSYYTNKSIIIIIFTLFLGSWWALQEGSWGGWWNWDPSEVLGLLVMLIHLVYLHRNVKLYNYITSVQYINLCWQLIFFAYIFIQFNFDLVSHNFGTRVDQFIDSSHNFLLIILITVIGIVNVCYRYCVSIENFSLNTGLRLDKFYLTWSILIFGLIMFVSLSSFSLLINDFFWKIVQVNIFNTNKLTYYFTPMLITLLLMRLWNLSLYLVIGYFTTTSSTVVVLLLVIMLQVRQVNLFHIFLITSLFSMLIEYNNNLSLWDIISECSSMNQGGIISDFFNITLSLNNFFIEYSKPVLLNNSPTEWLWNTIWVSSSVDNHSFMHPQSTYYLNQSLYSGNTLSSYLITVLDLAVSSTSLLINLLFGFMFQLIRKNKLITL